MPRKASRERRCDDCGKPKCRCADRADGFIYILLASKVNRVKIGFSSDMRGRFEKLQFISPVALEVIKVWRGSIALEKAIHSRFFRARRHGEWFEMTPELVQFLDTFPNKHRLRASDIPNFD